MLAWAVTTGATRSVAATRFDAEGLAVGLPLTLLSTEGAFPEPIALRAGEGAFGVRACTFDGAADALVRSAAQCAPSE